MVREDGVIDDVIGAIGRANPELKGLAGYDHIPYVNGIEVREYSTLEYVHFGDTVLKIVSRMPFPGEE